MSDNMIKGVGFTIVLLAVAVSLGLSALVTVAIHYGLVQLFPDWVDWVRWVLAFFLAAFLMSAGRTVTVRNKS